MPSYPGTGIIAEGRGEATGRAANLLLNGSFEEGAIGAFPAFNWWSRARTPAGANDMNVVASDRPSGAADGEHSLSLAAATTGGAMPNATTNSLVSWVVPVPQATGTVLRLRANRLYTSVGASVVARLTVTALDASGASLGVLATVDQATQEFFWAVIDQTITATPANTMSIQVSLGFITTGSTSASATCYWDNLYVDTLYDVTGLYPRGKSVDAWYYVVAFSGRPGTAAATAANYSLAWSGGSATPASAARGTAGGVDDNRVLLKFTSHPAAGTSATLTVSGVTRASDSQALNGATASATTFASAPIFAESFQQFPLGALASQVAPHNLATIGGGGSITVQRATTVERDQCVALVSDGSTSPQFSKTLDRGSPRGVVGARFSLYTPTMPVATREFFTINASTSSIADFETTGTNYQSVYQGNGSSGTATVAAVGGSDTASKHVWGMFAVGGDGFGILEWSKDGTRVYAGSGLALLDSQMVPTIAYYGLLASGGVANTIYLDDLLVDGGYIAPASAPVAGSAGAIGSKLYPWRDAFASLAGSYAQWHTGGLSLVTTGLHYGTHSLRAAGDATSYPCLRATFDVAPTALYARFWLRAITLPTSGIPAVIASWPGVAYLRLAADYLLELVDTAGTRIACRANGDGFWHAYEVYLAPNGSVGTGTIWQDGARLATTSALTAQATNFSGGVVLGSCDYGAWTGDFADFQLSSAYIGPGALFAAGFEGGDLTAWDVAADATLVTNTAPTIVSDTALARTETRALWASATSQRSWARGYFAPQDLSNTVYARAWVRLRSASTDTWLLEISTSADVAAYRVGWKQSTGTLQIQTRNTTTIDTGHVFAADDQWHALEIAVTAQLPGNADFYFALVDGALIHTRLESGARNATLRSVVLGATTVATASILYDDVWAGTLGPVGPGPTIGAVRVAGITGSTADPVWPAGSVGSGYPALAGYVLDVNTSAYGAVRWEEGGGQGGGPAPTDNGDTGTIAGCPVGYTVASGVIGKPLSGLTADTAYYARVRWVDALGDWVAGWAVFVPRNTALGPLPATRPRYEIRLLDASLELVGILSSFKTLQYVRRVSQIGGFELHGGVFAGPQATNQVQRLQWLQVWRNGVLDFMGEVRHREYMLEKDASRYAWNLHAAGQSPEAALARRIAAYGIALSGIAAPPWGVFTPPTDVRTGQADKILAQYIDYNAGPSCPYAAMRLPNFVVPTPATNAAIANRTYEARLETLLDLASKFTAFDVQFAVVFDPSAGQFSFTTYYPFLGENRTVGNDDGNTPVIFSPETGTVSAFSFWETGLDIVNHYVVGGSGDGAARLFAEITDPASEATWGRAVGFLNANVGSNGVTSTNDQLAAMRSQAEASLEDAGQPKIGTKYDVIPTSGARYKDDWDLGDLVTVQAADIGLQLIDTVTEITVSLDGSADMQETVAILTGRPPTRLFKKFARLHQTIHEAGRR